MSESINLAHAATISGGIATTIGAFNLDKPWGSLLVGAGKGVDLVDGTIARELGIDGENRARLDTAVDRITEGVIVASLIEQDIIPASLPIVGYSMLLASKHLKNEKPTSFGTIAMLLKDISITAGVAATHYTEATKIRRYLTRSARILGWTAVGLGVKDLI